MSYPSSKVTDLEQVRKLQKKTDEQLQKCLATQRQFLKMLEDYEALSSRLITLPEQISHEVMVPIGALAYMPGRIVHTNEIMVLLGDNWFVERSAKQAADIAKRRMVFCQSMLTKLQIEEQQILSWMKYSKEVEGGELVEIMEKYDPDEEKDWREKHRESVQKYKKSEALSRSQSNTSNTKLEESVNNTVHNSVESSKVCDKIDEVIVKHIKPRVKWNDSENAAVKIVFSHSEFQERRGSSELMNSNEINSPTDIYKQFGVRRKKSILKQTELTSSFNSKVQIEKIQTVTLPIEPEPLKSPIIKSSSSKAFTGEVIDKEKVENIPSNESTTTNRPISKFKAKRQNIVINDI